MAVYEVFSYPELRRYRTNVCSKASLVLLFCTILTLGGPLIIAFQSQGFWQRQDYYREQPDIKFKHEVLIMLESIDSGTQSTSYIVWSTFQNFNQLQTNNVRIPLVKSREADSNRDGKYDKLYFELEMPVFDAENVHSVIALLFFEYKLYRYSRFTMESMAYIHHESSRPGAQLFMLGDLKFKQKEYLGHTGVDTRYNTPVIDKTSIFAETYDLTQIFSSYSQRNFSTILDAPYPVWTVGRGNNQPFTLKAEIVYPEETIVYMPGFWQLIKWAWIQYVSYLLIFIFVFDKIKIFIFENQVVPTILIRPFKEKKF